MTRDEHIMTTVAEECVECAQRMTKILRFGLDEVQPGQVVPKTNRQRFTLEYSQLVGMLRLVRDADGQPAGLDKVDEDVARAKQAKFESFLLYSQTCGTLMEGQVGTTVSE